MTACRFEEIELISQKIIQKIIEDTKSQKSLFKDLLTVHISEKNASLHFSDEYKRIMVKQLLESSSTIEPVGDAYKKQATAIRKGNWLDLDFKSPDFLITMYKCFRLELINSYQLSTTILWWAGIEQFKDAFGRTKVSLHSFEDKDGPYDPASIKYATKEDIAEFKTSLKELPPGERTYLTVDIPPQHEALLLLTLLGKRVIYTDSHFSMFYRDYLKKYFTRTATSTENKDELIKQVDSLPSEESFKTLTKFLNAKLKNDFPVVIDYSIEGSNFNFSMYPYDHNVASLVHLYAYMVTILNLGEQHPGLVVSANYNEKDPTTSIASIVLPTTAALLKLQKAVHHADTAYPEFRAGQLSTRDLLKTFLDSKNYKRLVELPYPGLKHMDKIDGVNYTPFLQLWHDLILHVWRTGGNVYKDLIYLLVDSLLKYQKFDMSKILWLLVDMDFGQGLGFRLDSLKRDSSGNMYESYFKLLYFVNLLERIIPNFFLSSEYNDLKILFIIDMILHREEWKATLGKYPEDFFPKATFIDNFWPETPTYRIAISDSKVIFENKNFTQLQLDLAVLKNIIESHPFKDAHTDAMFYILAFRLKNHEAGMKLLNEWADLGLDKIFTWQKNAGITTKVEGYNSRLTLEKLSGDDLYNEFKTINEFILLHKINLDEVLETVVDAKLCSSENKITLMSHLKRLVDEFDLKKEQQSLLIEITKNHIQSYKGKTYGLFFSTPDYYLLDHCAIKIELQQKLKSSSYLSLHPV